MLLSLIALQIRRQAQEVVGLLGAAQGFRKVTSGQKGIAARRVVAQVLHSLSKLGDALGGILPSQVYVQAAGQVLQHVLETVIGELALKILTVDILSFLGHYSRVCCGDHTDELP